MLARHNQIGSHLNVAIRADQLSLCGILGPRWLFETYWENMFINLAVKILNLCC
jgi:hypothetical protein